MCSLGLQRLEQCRHPPSSLSAAVTMRLVVGARNAELVKKDIAHIGIEMLACMHQGFAQAIGIGNGFRDDAGFNKLRACADDGEDVFHISTKSIVFFAFYR